MVLDDEEIVNWLEEVCKEEPFKSTKDLSIVLPEETGYPMRVLGPSEKWKDKEVHFFASSWLTEPKIFAKEVSTIADQLEEVKCMLPKGGCLDLYD